MHKKILTIILSLLLIVGFSTSGFTAKVPAPEKGGDGFKAVSEALIAVNKNDFTALIITEGDAGKLKTCDFAQSDRLNLRQIRAQILPSYF